MTWVLWDILVPLVCSFGLGVLLCWVLFSRYGQSLVPKVGNADNVANASERVAVDNIGIKRKNSGGALSELQAANITLIGERDKVSLNLEELSAQMALSKTRNEELEAQLLELEITAQSNDTDTERSAAATVEAVKEPLLSVDTQDADNSEQLQLQENVKSLNNALDIERRAKRELELQLLNIKNQCEKLEVQVNEGKLEKEASIDADNVDRLSENEWRDQYESVLQHTQSLEDELERKNSQIVEFKATELSSVKAHTEELKGAITKGDAKDVEIENLNVTIERLKESAAAMTPTIEVDQYRAEITVRDAEIETLKSRLANVPTNTEVGTNGEAALLSKTIEEKASSGCTIPAKAPSKKEQDKLTNIKGVGPAIEEWLHASGIYYYRQIAGLDKGGIEELQQQIPQFPGRIERDKWVKQASKLHHEKYGSTA